MQLFHHPVDTPRGFQYMNAKALFERVFQVALSSATNLVARNQMQLVGIYALFVGEQRFSGCTLCKKNLSFCG